jgi:type IV pilus assembly protein PilX
MRHTHHFPGNQRGAVLIVSLIFLVILTMLGLTAMTSTTFEERMAGNSRDAAIAHHAAEAALREARDEVLDINSNSRHLHMSWFSLPPVDDVGACAISGICRSRQLLPVGTTKPVTLPDLPTNVNWTETAKGGTTAEYGEWSSAQALFGVSKRPRYTIELFCASLAVEGRNTGSLCRLYRFTAVGWGKNPNTQVTLQETYLAEKPGT